MSAREPGAKHPANGELDHETAKRVHDIMTAASQATAKQSFGECNKIMSEAHDIMTATSQATAKQSFGECDKIMSEAMINYLY